MSFGPVPFDTNVGAKLASSTYDHIPNLFILTLHIMIYLIFFLLIRYFNCKRSGDVKHPRSSWALSFFLLFQCLLESQRHCRFWLLCGSCDSNNFITIEKLHQVASPRGCNNPTVLAILAADYNPPFSAVC